MILHYILFQSRSETTNMNIPVTKIKKIDRRLCDLFTILSRQLDLSVAVAT
jgi:hypothetical protein